MANGKATAAAQPAADYQVAVVGAGPAGYAAAIRSAQLGMRTVCIDDRLSPDGDNASLGGTCLNVGCIPSKALLERSLRYSQLQAGVPGVRISGIELDLPAVMAAKQAIVDKLCGGVAQLFKGYGVESLQGRATLAGAGRLLLDGSTAISADNVILAPGSAPMPIPPAPFDGERIVDSTDALSLAQVPQKLCVIGAGAVGLELGSVWARLGSQVTVLEALEDFLPHLDRDMARLALRALSRQGLDIRLGCQVQAAEAGDRAVRVRWSGGGQTAGQAAGQTAGQTEEQAAEFDRVIVAAGRRPNTEQLLAEGCGLQTDDRGFIPVDRHCATALPGVWAVGDAAAGPDAAPMLAHRATDEGVMVAERLAGEPAEVNYPLVPTVIYTHPEIASIGLSSADCQAQGLERRTGAFPFAANGRALSAGEGEGKVKLLSEAGSGRLLGAQVMGPSAAELVQQVAVAMEFGAQAEDLALTMFSHPTVGEVLREAALDLADKPLHQIRKLPAAAGRQSS